MTFFNKLMDLPYGICPTCHFYRNANNGMGLNTNVYFDDMTVTELGQP